MGAQIGSVEAFATFEDSDTEINLSGEINYSIYVVLDFFLKKFQNKLLILKLSSLVR